MDGWLIIDSAWADDPVLGCIIPGMLPCRALLIELQRTENGLELPEI